MLSKMTIRALKKLASSEGLPNYGRNTKAELVSRLHYLEEYTSCELVTNLSEEEKEVLGVLNSFPSEEAPPTPAWVGMVAFIIALVWLIVGALRKGTALLVSPISKPLIQQWYLFSQVNFTFLNTGES